MVFEAVGEFLSIYFCNIPCSRINIFLSINICRNFFSNSTLCLSQHELIFLGGGICDLSPQPSGPEPPDIRHMLAIPRFALENARYPVKLNKGLHILDQQVLAL